VSDLLFSLLLNGYIKILAAVEQRSIKRGGEGDVSPLRTEDLPSSNHFLIFRHPSIKAPLLAHLSSTQWLEKYPFFIFNVLLCATDCWVSIKVPRPPLDSWSKALLKACEAQAILVKPDLVSEDAWEKNSACGMHALNERCEGEISLRITFIDANSVVSDIYGRLAPLKTGMKMIRISKSTAS
jgi:hypothetical protein